MSPSEPCADALAGLRQAERASGSIGIAERKELLARLEQGVLRRKEAVARAADADFGGRSREETLFGEVLGVVSILRHARHHLERWARPRRVPVGLPFWPARAWIVPQPLGIVGVMAPWNYPFLLSLAPLGGAIAAGNRVMLKPSEHTPGVAAELQALLEECLGPTVARTILGGPDTARSFARQRFDHLVFTGGTARGREVAVAAAANLVPVTLELGGKCPAIVLPDADLDAAARAIVTGKGLNAGQTCVAPDHVLLAGLSPERFVPKLQAAVERCFPAGLPTRVIPHQRPRLAANGLEGNRLAIVLDPPEDSPLVQEEIFAPVLPVHPVADLDQAIHRVNRMAPPLATYLFTRDRDAEKRVLHELMAGALVVGGTVLHAAMADLPFGGVGASGMGRYHGQAGFDSLSNLKAHVRAPRIHLAGLGQPPYGRTAARLLQRLLPDPRRGK